MNWRQDWEYHSEQNRKKLDAIPVEQLLRQVRNGQYGDYYSIWYSIAERSTLKQAGWILFEILSKKIDYLYRYHCAAALLSLLKVTHIEPVQLSGDEPNVVEENLKVVKALLEKTIGNST